MAIGDLNESPLHASLKRLLVPAGSRFEVAVEGYVIDAVHAGVLVEVQTRQVGRLKAKLANLLPEHRVRLVVPVASERWILRRGAAGDARRRSPKRAGLLDALAELVAIPHLLDHPNLEVEVALTIEEEIREHRPGVAWRRRGWVTVERRLLGVESRKRLRGARSWIEALPPGLPERFTTLDVAEGRRSRRTTAQRATFVLREAGVLVQCGRSGRSFAYALAPHARDRLVERSRALASEEGV